MEVLDLLRFETFMDCDGLTLCDVYIMKLLCCGNLTIFDATLSDIYDVLCGVLSQCYVTFCRSIGYGVGVRGECGGRRCKEKSIMKV
jgi:hypothetical protein